MAYRHEVVDSQGNLFMSHYRLAEGQSGLLIVEEIARTYPTILHPSQPSRLTIMRSIDSLGELSESGPEAIVDTIECADLNAFIDHGARRWLELLPRLGRVGTMMLSLAERISVTDKATPGGILLPEPPDTEFKGYFAGLAEIEALEAMANRVRQGIAEMGPPISTGQYL